ncbi:unnamed protein product, partial [marine sediment metagenome]
MLKLIDGKTVIYVNNQVFRQCKLVAYYIKPINQSSKEIKSIDDMIDNLPTSIPKIGEKEEFWVHCSNLQAWAENN